MATKTKKVRFVFNDGTSGLYRVVFNLAQCIIAQPADQRKLVIINKEFIASRS